MERNETGGCTKKRDLVQTLVVSVSEDTKFQHEHGICWQASTQLLHDPNPPTPAYLGALQALENQSASAHSWPLVELGYRNLRFSRTHKFLTLDTLDFPQWTEYVSMYAVNCMECSILDLLVAYLGMYLTYYIRPKYLQRLTQPLWLCVSCLPKSPGFTRVEPITVPMKGGNGPVGILN